MPLLNCNYSIRIVIVVVCMALSCGTSLVYSAINVLCLLRRSLKNVWKLPLNTRANLIYALSCVRPIEVELKCKVLNFVLNCLNSVVGLVRSVTRHVIIYISLFRQNRQPQTNKQYKKEKTTT